MEMPTWFILRSHGLGLGGLKVSENIGWRYQHWVTWWAFIKPQWCSICSVRDQEHRHEHGGWGGISCVLGLFSREKKKITSDTQPISTGLSKLQPALRQGSTSEENVCIHRCDTVDILWVTKQGANWDYLDLFKILLHPFNRKHRG